MYNEYETGLGEDYFFEGGIRPRGIELKDELYPSAEVDERKLILSVRGKNVFER